MERVTLAEGGRTFGLDLAPAQTEAYEVFLRELANWNTRVNLTSISDPAQVVVKHLWDSFSVAPLLRSTPSASLVDIGTGAGFPGLVLKIALPELRVTLVEATRKKVDFLKHVIAKLQLRNVNAVQARAEDLAHDPAHREAYDFAVARAVAELSVLLEYALPFVRVGGLFIAQKGVQVDEEIRAASRALQVLGGRTRESVPVQLPGLEPRHLILVDKIAQTPPSFPRRAGIPERKPIR
jgi:16S rRNA (guanine527-N7)-methyltransferase